MCAALPPLNGSSAKRYSNKACAWPSSDRQPASTVTARAPRRGAGAQRRAAPPQRWPRHRMRTPAYRRARAGRPPCRRSACGRRGRCPPHRRRSSVPPAVPRQAPLHSPGGPLQARAARGRCRHTRPVRGAARRARRARRSPARPARPARPRACSCGPGRRRQGAEPRGAARRRARRGAARRRRRPGTAAPPTRRAPRARPGAGGPRAPAHAQGCAWHELHWLGSVHAASCSPCPASEGLALGRAGAPATLPSKAAG